MLSLFLRLVSPKAHRKIVMLGNLDQLGAATGGEVTTVHLGSGWAALHPQPASPTLP